ncbi:MULTISPECIES: TetR/AcrR family transcriptional regulator [Catenuloplanes]|uniref:DNA-binding transcriptional regulator YbjK n=1 Tax=Catenuloplanes niger TaxID=587534 RepID=A0AAE3ZTN9_9ACTN|nr:TetR family transcriptional regulator [Catenuloplanes niger]MDR7325878.1 DNA-binding transcriptional regulator YbjK [Catenuloplanes niger]
MNDVRGLTVRGAARRAALLDAAVSVVASTGSGGLTHRAVAATAKVSLASVTYHFSSIEDLRRALFEHALQIIDDQLTATAATGTPDELPRLMADYVVALVTRRGEAAAAVQELIVAAIRDPALRSTYHDHHQRVATLLTPCVGEHTLGLAVAASIQGLIVTALTYPDLDTVELHAAIVTLINQVSTGHRA